MMAYFKILIFLHFGKYLGFMYYVVGSPGVCFKQNLTAVQRARALFTTAFCLKHFPHPLCLLILYVLPNPPEKKCVLDPSSLFLTLQFIIIYMSVRHCAGVFHAGRNIISRCSPCY